MVKGNTKKKKFQCNSQGIMGRNFRNGRWVLYTVLPHSQYCNVANMPLGIYIHIYTYDNVYVDALRSEHCRVGQSVAKIQGL